MTLRPKFRRNAVVFPLTLLRIQLLFQSEETVSFEELKSISDLSSATMFSGQMNHSVNFAQFHYCASFPQFVPSRVTELCIRFFWNT